MENTRVIPATTKMKIRNKTNLEDWLIGSSNLALEGSGGLRAAKLKPGLESSVNPPQQRMAATATCPSGCSPKAP